MDNGSSTIGGQVYIARGDITHLQADAIAVTYGSSFWHSSSAFQALVEQAEVDFAHEYKIARDAFAEQRTAFWVPLRSTSPPYGVVFVAPHPRPSTGKLHSAYRVATSAVATAVESLRQKTNLPVLVALVAFRMKQGADRDDRLRSARAQIEAAYEAVEHHADVDIAFILDDDTKYEIFLDARREVLAEIGRSPGPIPVDDLSPLTGALKNGECVIFVGAGFSQNSGLPSYVDLIREMATRIGLDDDLTGDVDTLLDVAQCFRDQDRDGQQVTELLHEYFRRGALGAMPSLAHYLAMSLPVRFIVTTNYDHLLEITLKHLRRFPLRVVSKDQVARTGYRDGTYVVKFHGDTDEGHVVLSRSDYDGFFQDRPEMASLLEGLLLNQSFFFLGYSLRDPNFRQIYSKIDLMLRNAKRPAFLTTFETPKAATRQQYRNKQLNLIELGAEPYVTSDGIETRADTAEERYVRLRIEKSRRLFTFLDRLAEEVLSNRHLFLVADAQPVTGGPLQDVYESLRTTGLQLAEAIQKPLSAAETRTAARLLSALADLGWQGRGQGDLTELWDRLASNCDGVDGAERDQRQFLTSALKHAEDDSVAERILTHLVWVEEQCT